MSRAGLQSEGSSPRCLSALRPHLLLDPGGPGFTPRSDPPAPPNLSSPCPALGAAVKSQLCSSPPRPSEEHPGPAACGGAGGRRPSAAGNGKSAPGPCSPPRGPSPRLGSSGGGLGDLQVRSFPPVKIASAAREPLEKPQCWDSQGFVVFGVFFFPLPSLPVFLA